VDVSKKNDILIECLDAILAGENIESVVARHPNEPDLEALLRTALRVRESSKAYDDIPLPVFDRFVPVPADRSPRSEVRCIALGVLMMVLSLGVLFIFKDAVPTVTQVSLMTGWLVWWLTRSPWRDFSGQPVQNQSTATICIGSPTRTS
jgi:hypothetical protein